MIPRFGLVSNTKAQLVAPLAKDVPRVVDI